MYLFPSSDTVDHLCVTSLQRGRDVSLYHPNQRPDVPHLIVRKFQWPHAPLLDAVDLFSL